MRIPGAFLAIAVATSSAAESVRSPEVSIRPMARSGAEVKISAPSNAGFDRWIAEFRERAVAHGIRADVLDAALTGLRPTAT
jgi:membrane-bound lytic murein transglycosylase B